MTYQYIDVPANRDTVIDAIVNFAVTNAGFTNIGADGTLRRLSKSGLYFCFIPASRIAGTYYEIAVRLTTVEPTNSTYMSVDGQPYCSGIGTSTYAGPYVGLHLFTDGIEVNCALEVLPGAFAHLSFGYLFKFGSWTGGEYVTGSIYYSWWYVNQGTTSFSGGSGGLASYKNTLYYNSEFYPEAQKLNDKRVTWGGVTSTCNTPLYSLGYASYNYRRPLLPIYAIIDETGVRNKVVGVSKQARFLNLDGLQNKEIIEDDWMVFPYSQRTAIIGTVYDASYGLAYKR